MARLVAHRGGSALFIHGRLSAAAPETAIARVATRIISLNGVKLRRGTLETS